MAKIMGVDIGKSVCDTLGIDSQYVLSVIIKIPANDVVTILVERYALEDELVSITKVITEKYELQLKGTIPIPPVFPPDRVELDSLDPSRDAKKTR
jgi:hypothetical protein